MKSYEVKGIFRGDFKRILVCARSKKEAVVRAMKTADNYFGKTRFKLVSVSLY